MKLNKEKKRDTPNGYPVYQTVSSVRQLKIEGLGQVNLITGRNNTGKSSVLEALRILASDASPSVIYDILRFREEDSGAKEIRPPVASEVRFRYQACFTDFPSFQRHWSQS